MNSNLVWVQIFETSREFWSSTCLILVILLMPQKTIEFYQLSYLGLWLNSLSRKIRPLSHHFVLLLLPAMVSSFWMQFKIFYCLSVIFKSWMCSPFSEVAFKRMERQSKIIVLFSRIYLFESKIWGTRISVIFNWHTHNKSFLQGTYSRHDSFKYIQEKLKNDDLTLKSLNTSLEFWK